MEPRTDPPGGASRSGGGSAGAGEPPTSSSTPPPQPPQPPAQQPLSRYESQKRRDWNTFLQYLKNHQPPLTLQRCSGAHVIEFLKYLDQFGKTKVHADACPHFGKPNPPLPCACPLKQAWGSLDALIGRLRAAYEESGGRPESNPFAARAVRIYLREVRESQAKARGIPYEKKKRKRGPPVVGSISGSGSAPAPPETSGEAEVEEEEKPSSSTVDSVVAAAATTAAASTVLISAASTTGTISTSVGTVGTSAGTRIATVGASSSCKDAKKKSRSK